MDKTKIKIAHLSRGVLENPQGEVLKFKIY